jgi:hypothetical protein
MKRFAMFIPLALLLAIPLGCAPSTHRAPPPYGSQQQWEYKVVKLDKGEDRDLGVLLNALAKEGWEFVGQITTEDRHIVFKRATAPRFGPMNGVMTAPAFRGETRAMPRPSTIKATSAVKPTGVAVPKGPPPPPM